MSAVRRWDGLTWEETLAADALLVLPVGSTEQHGPHLATGTDALIATAVAERAAAAAARPETIVLAPTLAYGASDHHLPFGGTLSLGVSTFQLLLGDLLASAASAGFRRVFVLNGHGGNAAACAIAVAEASRRHGLLAAAAMPSDLVEAGEIEGPLHGHAGSFETSLVLALDPSGSGSTWRGRLRAAAHAARGRGGSSSASPGAGRSSTASPTGPTRPRASAASRRSPRAWPPSPRPSSSSPAPVPEIRADDRGGRDGDRERAGEARAGVRGQRVVHDASTFTLVRVVTDDGIEGFGEVSATAAWSGEDAVTATHFVRDVLGPA